MFLRKLRHIFKFIQITSHIMNFLRKGLKKLFLSLCGLTPPPPKTHKKYFLFFLDTKPFFEHFLKKKMLFAPRKSENTFFNFQNLPRMNRTESCQGGYRQHYGGTLHCAACRLHHVAF